MRNFLVALCIASLSFSGVGMASGGTASKQLIGKKPLEQLVNKVKKAGAMIAVGALVLGTACGLNGCDQSMNMAKDIVSAPMFEGEPIEIGVIYEHGFEQSWNGATLAAKQANLAGGINGREVVLIPKVVYERSRVETVLHAENLIVHDEVIAIIGANYSFISELIDEVVAVYGVPMVTMGSTSATLTRASESIFLAAFPDTFQGDVMANLAINDLNANTAAVIFWGEDHYSVGLAGSFRESFDKRGGSVIAYKPYSYETTMDNQDFAAYLNNSGIINDVAATSPDVVFLPGFSESGLVAVELRKAGVTATLLGADGWGAGNLFELGGNAVNGAYYSDHFTPDAAPEFTKAYTAEFGMAPDGLAALGFDAAGVTLQAAQRAGDDLTRDTLREQIGATENYMGATNIDRYDDERHPIKSAVIYQIMDGKAVYDRTVSPQ